MSPGADRDLLPMSRHGTEYKPSGFDVTVRSDAPETVDDGFKRLGATASVHSVEARTPIPGWPSRPRACELRRLGGPAQCLVLHLAREAKSGRRERVPECRVSAARSEFVLRPFWHARGRSERVEPSEFAVGQVDLRVVQIRSGDPGFEVVAHRRPETPAEELERRHMHRSRCFGPPHTVHEQVPVTRQIIATPNATRRPETSHHITEPCRMFWASLPGFTAPRAP